MIEIFQFVRITIIKKRFPGNSHICSKYKIQNYSGSCICYGMITFPVFIQNNKFPFKDVYNINQFKKTTIDGKFNIRF